MGRTTGTLTSNNIPHYSQSQSQIYYGNKGDFRGHDYKKKENNRYPIPARYPIFAQKTYNSSSKQFDSRSYDGKKVFSQGKRQRLNFSFQKVINKRIIKSHSVEEILEIYGVEGQRLDVVNLATILYNIGKKYKDGGGNRSQIIREIKNNRLFYELVDHILERIGDFHNRHLTNFAWVFATLGIKNQKFFAAIESEFFRKRGDFNPQNLSNFAWALATLGFKNQRLFDAILVEVMKKIGNFKTQDLSNLAWAFATLKIKDKDFFAVIADEAIRKMRHFNVIELVNLAWAFATLDIRNKKLFTAIAEETLRKIKNFDAQGFANLTQAFATFDIRHPRLFTAIANEAVRKIGIFSAWQLVNLARAFSTLDIREPRFFTAIADAAMSKIGNFNAQELAELARAFAALNIRNQKLFKAIAAEALKKIEDFNAQNLADIAWAFAVIDWEDVQFVGKLMKGFFGELLDVRHVIPLSQSFYYFQLKEKGCVDWKDFPFHFQFEYFEDDEKLRFPEFSKMYENVSDILSKDGFQFKGKYYCEPFYFLPIAFPEKKVGIEINGLFHYADDKSLLGNALLKKRILEMCGWKIITIPYWEFDDFERDHYPEIKKQLKD